MLKNCSIRLKSSVNKRSELLPSAQTKGVLTRDSIRKIKSLNCEAVIEGFIKNKIVPLGLLESYRATCCLSTLQDAGANSFVLQAQSKQPIASAPPQPSLLAG